jgi:hypothetical protein
LGFRVQGLVLRGWGLGFGGWGLGSGVRDLGFGVWGDKEDARALKVSGLGFRFRV